jgi:hypothetical protein
MECSITYTHARVGHTHKRVTLDNCANSDGMLPSIKGLRSRNLQTVHGAHEHTPQSQVRDVCIWIPARQGQLSGGCTHVTRCASDYYASFRLVANYKSHFPRICLDPTLFFLRVLSAHFIFGLEKGKHTLGNEDRQIGHSSAYLGMYMPSREINS